MMVAFSAVFALTAVVFFTAAAGQHTPVTVCHNVQNNPHEIVVDDSSVDLQGHQAHIDSGFDTLGPCPTDTTSPPTTEGPTGTTEPPAVSPTETERPADVAPAAQPAAAVQAGSVSLTG